MVDPEARHAHKSRTNHQDGFKAHVAVEPETGLFTAGRLTKATGPDCSDGALVGDLLAGDAESLEILADSGYGSAEVRAGLAEANHQAVIKPIPVPIVVPGGFTYDDFDAICSPARRSVQPGMPNASLAACA